MLICEIGQIDLMTRAKRKIDDNLVDLSESDLSEPSLVHRAIPNSQSKS